MQTALAWLLAMLAQHLVGHLEHRPARESLAAPGLSLPRDMLSRIGEAIQQEVG